MPKQSNARETKLPKSKSLSLNEAKEQILKGRSNLLHARLVEEEAFYRLRNYPGQIKENLHSTLVRIPRKVAHVLHQSPAYVSPAVEAFYVRDPISLRPLQAQASENLRFAPKDLVTARVKFTKVGYAQLKSQQIAVPPAWRNASDSSMMTSKPEFETGMKLTCGFEMLISDPHNQDKKAVREIEIMLEDIDSGETSLPSDGEIAAWGTTGDDESWMDINFRDFEGELSGGTKGEGLSGFGDKSAQENLRRMVSRFEEFLNDDTAGMEGAELDDMDDDDDDDDEVDSLSSDDEGEDRAASFDEDEFTKMMREMMGMPRETMEELMGPAASKHRRQGVQAGAMADQKGDNTGDSEGDNTKEIERLAAAMEVELKAAGALQLDPGRNAGQEPMRDSRFKDEKTVADDEDGEEGEASHEQYNLAKNVMESFKIQGGAPGPGGNMMGLMGVRLPRDEEGNDLHEIGETGSG